MAYYTRRHSHALHGILQMNSISISKEQHEKLKDLFFVLRELSPRVEYSILYTDALLHNYKRMLNTRTIARIAAAIDQSINLVKGNAELCYVHYSGYKAIQDITYCYNEMYPNNPIYTEQPKPYTEDCVPVIDIDDGDTEDFNPRLLLIPIGIIITTLGIIAYLLSK